jgi:hypothetical protein
MEAAAAGAATERAAVIDHVRRKLAVAQRDPANDHLVRVLDELAEDFSRGLHLR